ncbi:GNAT superfamily N-acetyltransferase [Salirhabdus euzebyi]|uniref:GNAT superfamily N-acetyltransferase n=1 Tax=Salirhabdus euzebyi TaxID=394506 RepID=A0A841PT98_9BACI|nr:GNAT family N-acetyltransferase [Salirhabdus euzebyi]MBB6452049.1 GNAT superfamily N-acetyltransferase [Salirhabdus euzebyi]
MQAKRIKMKLLLDHQVIKKDILSTNLTSVNTSMLGNLMYSAYKDTIDYEGETVEQFIKEIQATLNGKYGKLLSDCSYMIELKNLPVATTIISLFKGAPFVTYNVTHPEHHNKGFSTFLIKKSINSLVEQGYKELFLMVTEGNASAQHMYRKIGFIEQQGEWDELIKRI